MLYFITDYTGKQYLFTDVFEAFEAVNYLKDKYPNETVKLDVVDGR